MKISRSVYVYSENPGKTGLLKTVKSQGQGDQNLLTFPKAQVSFLGLINFRNPGRT